MTAEMERQIIEFAKPHMEGHHDLVHYKRVEKFARRLWEREEGDWEVIFTAVWLHDIGRKESVPDHPKIGARLAREFLPTIGFPTGKIEAVVRAILIHDDHGAQSTIEEKIVYDADRLDCFSYSGLLRCYLEPYKNGKVITLPELVVEVENYLTTAYESLNTDTARQIATGYKEEYLDNFLKKVAAEQQTD